MMKRRLKKNVAYGIYAVAVTALVGSIALIEMNTKKPMKENSDQKYVDRTIFEENIPVISTQATIIRPYTETDIKIVKNYYEFDGEKENQQNSLIVHDNTYLQNSGVAYGEKGNFDVVSILDGTVISIKEDEMLGKIIEIRHTNEIISIYQSLSEIFVQVDDQVTQGSIIGKAGMSNISTDLKEHVHFELIVRGTTVNPEYFYDKNVNEI